jgi:hypothetical protein
MAQTITYRGETVEVKVESTFKGGTGLMANVVAVKGYPFYLQDTQAQGATFGAWMCNGYRIRVDFIDGWFGSKAWFESIAPIPL